MKRVQVPVLRDLTFQWERGQVNKIITDYNKGYEECSGEGTTARESCR